MDKSTNNRYENEKIPILNYFNYNHWRYIMIAKLLEKNFDKIIWAEQEDSTLPSEINAEALLFIYKYLSSELQQQFQSERSAKNLWLKLNEYFERSKSTLITFIRLKCQMGKSREYCTQFFTMIEHLHMYGIRFDQNITMELFLSKLPAEFDSLIHNIRYNSSNRTYSIDEIKSIIFCYESIFEVNKQNVKQQQQQQRQQHPLQNQYCYHQQQQQHRNNSANGIPPNAGGYCHPNFVPQFQFVPPNFYGQNFEFQQQQQQQQYK